jgi:hypothetical protein
LVVELEHLKTKTRLIDEKFVSVRGECETSRNRCPIYIRLIRKTTTFTRIFPTPDLIIEEKAARW